MVIYFVEYNVFINNLVKQNNFPDNSVIIYSE